MLSSPIWNTVQDSHTNREAGLLIINWLNVYHGSTSSTLKKSGIEKKSWQKVNYILRLCRFITKKMKFDEILIDIGEFGAFQKRNYVLLIIGWVLTAPFMVLSVFVLAMPEHR